MFKKTRSVLKENRKIKSKRELPTEEEQRLKKRLGTDVIIHLFSQKIAWNHSNFFPVLMNTNDYQQP